MTDRATLGRDPVPAPTPLAGAHAAAPGPGYVALAVLRRLDRWDRLAGAQVVIGAVAWAWLASGGGLQLDDVRAQAYAADQPFWPFIVQSNRTHLSPGARTVDWLHSHYAPFEWWPAVVLITTVAAVLGVVVWIVLKHLVGGGPASLVGLFWALFCPALIPGFAWYRQAITIGVPIVLMLVSMLSAIAAIRGRSKWFVPTALLLHALALGFSERAVLLPPVLLVAFVLLRNASDPDPAWRFLRRGRPMLLLGGMALTNVVFLLAYRSGDFDDASSGNPTVGGFVASTSRSLFLNTLPAFVGGPLVWRRVLGGYSFADTPVLFAIVASTLVLAVAAVALRTGGLGSVGLRVGGVALSYVIPLYILIYVGRISRDKVTSVDDLRLYSDVVVATAITLAVALAALGNGRLLRGRSLGLIIIATTTVVALTAVSWSGWARTWHETTSRAYFTTALSEVRAAKGSILPTSFPDSLLPAFYQTDMSTSNFVHLVNPGVETTRVSARPQLLDWSGRVVPATYRLVARTVPPQNFCGFRLAPGEDTLRIEFDEPVPYQRSELVLLRVLAPDTTTLDVSVVDAEGDEHDVVGDDLPSLYRGPHVLAYQVPWQTRVAAIKVTPQEGHAGLCVTDAPIVLAVPK